jgi:hypothetical protein
MTNKINYNRRQFLQHSALGATALGAFPGMLFKRGKSRGVAIFAKACFGHPSPSKRQKLNATANAFGAPILA